jgi:hypothetical protein
MGWPVSKTPEEIGLRAINHAGQIVEVDYGLKFSPYCDSGGCLWNPLLSISDAWMLVTKLGSKDFIFNLDRLPEGWTEVQFDSSPGTAGGAAAGEDVKRAICEAALLAVTGETNE